MKFGMVLYTWYQLQSKMCLGREIESFWSNYQFFFALSIRCWRTRMLLTLDADEQQNDDSICWPGSFLPVIAVRSLLEPTNPTLKIIQERLHDYTIAEAKLVLEPTEQGISRALSKGALLTLTPAIHFYVINVEHGHMLYQMKQRVYTFVLFDQVEPTRSCVAMSTQSMFINIWWQFRRTGNSMNKTPLEQHCFHLFSPCVTHVHTKSRDVIEWTSSSWKASMTAMTLSAEERKMLEDSSWPCEAWTAQG